jgi:hypothetical protein
MTTTTKGYDYPKPGCWFDGGNDQRYNDKRVIDLAISYGFETDEHTEDLDAEDMASLQEEALTFLNARAHGLRKGVQKFLRELADRIEVP